PGQPAPTLVEVEWSPGPQLQTGCPVEQPWRDFSYMLLDRIRRLPRLTLLAAACAAISTVVTVVALIVWTWAPAAPTEAVAPTVAPAITSLPGMRVAELIQTS